MFNAGVSNWQQCGGMSFFGQDESIAGLAAGKRLASEGAKKVLVRPAGAGARSSSRPVAPG
jgi:hypothetical protein